MCSLIRSLYYDNTEDTLYRYPALFRQILWYMVLVLVPFSVFTKRPLDKKRQVAVLSVLGLMLYLQILRHMQDICIRLYRFCVPCDRRNRQSERISEPEIRAQG